jgi:ABC-type nickel/cobalt efflux system permease component RcnA
MEVADGHGASHQEAFPQAYHLIQQDLALIVTMFISQGLRPLPAHLILLLQLQPLLLAAAEQQPRHFQ